MRRRTTETTWARLGVAILATMAALALPAGASANHTLVSAWGGPAAGSGDGQMSLPSGIDTDSLDNVYVADFSPNDRIQKFSSDGEFMAKFGSSGNGGTVGTSDIQFNQPVDVAVDSDGNMYVADRFNNRVQKISPGGILQWIINGSLGAGQFDQPSGVATDSADNVYVTDRGNNRIQKFDSAGTFIDDFGSGADFSSPAGLDIDATTIYVADSGNNRIQRLTTTGTFLTPLTPLIGTAFNNPNDVSVGETGNLIVADTDNSRIVELTTLGTTVAEWPPGGSFSFPQGVATGSLNSFFVVDTFDHRVMKFSAPPNGSTVRVSGTRLVFEGDGSNSDVSVTKSGSEYTFTDTGDIVTRGAGCTQNGADSVKCDPPGITVTSLRFVLGGGDDELSVTPTTPTTVIGGPGDDIINGSSGPNDTASYAGAPTAVIATLASVTGGADNDTLTGIENLTGSSNNDTLTGDSGDNVLTGGGGTDRVSYANAGAVVVNLGVTAPQNTVSAGTDTLVNIANLTGSPAGDTLTGSAVTNSILGGAGNDQIDVRDAGPDTVDCGADTDTATVDSQDTNTISNCETILLPVPGSGGGGGGGTAPAPAPGAGGGGGTGALVISGLGASKLRAGKKGSFRYTLSLAARVTLTIERPGPGRKAGAACKKQTRKNRKKRKCTFYAPTGKLTHPGKPGANTVPFSGKFAGKALKPGSYRITAVALSTTGAKSSAVTAKFKVTR